MAVPTALIHERKRVKVYELRQNDWFDRGTGFCGPQSIHEEVQIFVESEDQPSRELLNHHIRKEDTFQKQQETLIVWTDSEGTDMALSFQEAEGCAMIWDLLNDVQGRMADGSDSGLPIPLSLPPAQLNNLESIEDQIRRGTMSQQSRETVLKLIFADDYISQLTGLVQIAEEMESLEDLHRLCNIMKLLVLFNDSHIIEYIVKDDQILGFVGALEYDPDFPHHKANHRQYLSDASKYKEVVPMPSPEVTQKIHTTYRLQYLKDVVLARVLDDPTFNVLNSLIFFNQVEIVQHIQGNHDFLKQLVSVISSADSEARRRRDGVLLIQQCCSIAKGIQVATRTSLYSNLIACGLFSVISFALQHLDAAVRVAGTDVLVAMIDHDAPMIRAHINKAVSEKTKPMTDTLIELFLVETDLGVKSQIADAMKVLLDTNPPTGPGQDRPMGAEGGALFSKFRQAPQHNQQNDQFVDNFYDLSAKNLFRPLAELIKRKSLDSISPQEVSLFSHLVEILGFLVRQSGSGNAQRSQYFILSQGLSARVAQLLSCPEKHLKLSAVKYFRVSLAQNNEFYTRQIIQHRLLEPILSLIETTMGRDNLLNSACLELFEFIRRENVKPVVIHLAENYRERLIQLTYVDTFHGIIARYEQMMNPPPRLTGDPESSFMTTDSDTPNNQQTPASGAPRWPGPREGDEEDVWLNTSDNESSEDELSKEQSPTARLNGSRRPLGRPLVDYEDDDDSDTSTSETTPLADKSSPGGESPATSPGRLITAKESTPPSRPSSAMSEKRRREEDEDELSKLPVGVKRRNSVSTAGVKLQWDREAAEAQLKDVAGEDSPLRPSSRQSSRKVKQGPKGTNHSNQRPATVAPSGNAPSEGDQGNSTESRD